MAVTQQDIENAERDLDLTTREMKAEKNSTTAPSADEILEALRRRIAAAGAAMPAAPIPEPACRGCYQRGWMDALRAIKE